MKSFLPASKFVIAGVVAVLMGSAAFAAAPTYSDFDTSMKSELTTLKIPASEIGRLTVAEVAELGAILNGDAKKGAKAAEAEFLISTSLHPSTVTLDSAEGKKMVSGLTAKLEALKVTYPTTPLTATQVQALLDILDAHGGKHMKHEAGPIKAVLASINKPAVDVSTSTVVAMEADIDAKVTAAGLTAPPKGMMTYDQLGKLETIFATGAPADQKAAATKVLTAS